MATYYADAFDADEQISMEEWIAARIFDTNRGDIHEEDCAQLGRDILLHVLTHFRQDLMVEETAEEN